VRPSDNAGLVFDQRQESDTLFYAMPVTGVENDQRARIVAVLESDFFESTIAGVDAIVVRDALKDMAALNSADSKASFPTRLRYDGFAVVDPELGRHLLKCSNRSLRMLVEYNSYPVAGEWEDERRQELASFISTIATRRPITQSRWKNLR
jgi:hypothetical protein